MGAPARPQNKRAAIYKPDHARLQTTGKTLVCRSPLSSKTVAGATDFEIEPTQWKQTTSPLPHARVRAEGWGKRALRELPAWWRQKAALRPDPLLALVRAGS